MPFILADTDMESKNFSSKKDSSDAELNGTQILVSQICLYAEISTDYVKKSQALEILELILRLFLGFESC